MPESGARQAKMAETDSVSNHTHTVDVVAESRAHALEQLERRLSAAYSDLISAISDPTTESLDSLLSELRSASALVEDVETTSPEFMAGELSAIAEVCELVRHQKVPRRAAEVLIRKGDADRILETLARHGSLILTELANRIGKREQNLQTTLREMVATGLIRRDEVGQAKLYSATVLGKAALQWSQKEEEPARTLGTRVAGIFHPLEARDPSGRMMSLDQRKIVRHRFGAEGTSFEKK